MEIEEGSPDPPRPTTILSRSRTRSVEGVGLPAPKRHHPNYSNTLHKTEYWVIDLSEPKPGCAAPLKWTALSINTINAGNFCLAFKKKFLFQSPVTH